MRIKCHRATDGSPLFLLSISKSNLEPPHVFVLTKDTTEDLVFQVTSAVRSYDNRDSEGKSGPQPGPGKGDKA